MGNLGISVALLLAAAACGVHPGGETSDSGDAAAVGDGATAVVPGDGGYGSHACASVTNAAGTVVDFRWPAPSNTGNHADPGQTVRFEWTGTHDVIQVAYWDSTFTDPGWANELTSGAPSSVGTHDWNLGAFPCGYRPGIYFFVDQGNAVNGVVAISVTDAENTQHHYDPRPCSDLVEAANYGGRYAAYASRAGCTQYEVNNFQTEAHFDWVQPTFAATQGDLVLFRWTGIHNVVQVHDVDQDQPAGPTALNSGPKTNCVGGPNYQCVNGGPELGEFAIDTATYRPGLIHISDQCAYNRPDCPLGHSGAPSPTGMNMEFLLRRPASERPTVSAPGACCAIDRTKGQACRVIDVYNDNDGEQFDYNFPVNRGDLVRMRWAGTIRIVQTSPNADGSPSRAPRPGGVAMASPVECIPGPDGSRVGGNTDAAQFVFDVDQAMTHGDIETGNQFDFEAFGENTPGGSSQDSGIHFYVAQTAAYSPNAACP